MNPLALRASTSHASVAPEKNVNPRPSRIEAMAQPQIGAWVSHISRYKQSRDQKGSCPQQVRGSSTPGIGDDAGWDFEEERARREEGVDGEGLRVVQSRIEEKQGVDSPDERGRQGRQQRQHDVGTSYPKSLRGHKSRNLRAIVR